MTRSAIAMLVFASAALGQDAAVAQAGKSPRDFARYIGSGVYVDWGALWAALGNSGEPPERVPPCGDSSCSTEMLTVSNPSQAIVLLESNRAWDFYFRFLEQQGVWRYAGYYASEPSYPRRHEVSRLGGRPILRIAEVGARGGDLSLELERWFDLTLPDLQPVFTFPARGDQSRFAFGISRRLIGSAVPETKGSVETINLALQIAFSFRGVRLDSRSYQGRCERSSGQTAFFLVSASGRGGPMPTKQFDDLADITDGPSDAQMLVYAFEGLRRIATGKNSDTKIALKQMPDRLQPSPERQALLGLLAKP